MEKQSPLNSRVDEILGSLEGIQRATASPHLYTRIKGALTGREPFWVMLGRFLSKPVIAYSLSILLVLVNIWFILLSPAVQAEQRNEQLSDIAAEYYLSPGSVLDQPNNLP